MTVTRQHLTVGNYAVLVRKCLHGCFGCVFLSVKCYIKMHVFIQYGRWSTNIAFFQMKLNPKYRGQSSITWTILHYAEIFNMNPNSWTGTNMFIVKKCIIKMTNVSTFKYCCAYVFHHTIHMHRMRDFSILASFHLCSCFTYGKWDTAHVIMMSIYNTVLIIILYQTRFVISLK